MKLIKARSDRRDGAVKSAGFHFTQHGKSQGGAEGDTAVTFSQLPGSCVCGDRSTQLVFRTNQRPTRTCAFDSLPAVAAGVKLDVSGQEIRNPSGRLSQEPWRRRRRTRTRN